MTAIKVTVRGLDELQRKLSPALIARPARDFFNRATITVQTAARTRAKVDRGRWKNSIATEVDAAAVPRYGRIGSNLDAAPSIELGSRPHWPPIAPLEAWARRHGMPGAGFAIARGISLHGTPANHALTDGLAASRGALEGLVGVMAKEIETSFGKGGG